MDGRLFYKRGLRGARNRWLYLSGPRRDGEEDFTVYATGDGNLPSWAASPAAFWGAADRYERSTIRYRELMALLPRKLTHGQCIELARGYFRSLFGGRFAFSWAIQESRSRTREWALNPRAHVMFCDRARPEEDGPEPPRSRYFSAVPDKTGKPAGWPKAAEFRGRALKTWLRRAEDAWDEACRDALARAGFPSDLETPRTPPALRILKPSHSSHFQERRSSFCHR